MTTWAALRGDIADDLNRTDLNSQILSAINRAISYYSAESFWFQETSSTFSTTSGTYEYTTATIPTDISEIYYMEVTVSSFSYELRPRDIGYILDADPANFNGDPTDYAWYKNEIWLSPTPNATRTVTVYYYQDYSDLSLSGDTNAFINTNNVATDLIRARAEWMLYAQVLKAPNNAQICKQLEVDALAKLREQSENYKLPPKNINFQW